MKKSVGKAGTAAKGSRQAAAPATDGPGVIDVRVGARLRARRVLLGFTLNDVGDAVGLTFQQIQKYESGSNRISARRLYEFAQLLQVDIDYFFSEDDPPAVPAGASDPAMAREVQAFLRAFNDIEDPAIRRSVLNLTRALADD